MQMKNPSHPGDLIRDCLDELGVNVTDGAKALGVTRTALSRVINRKAGVSAEMALRLEKAIWQHGGFLAAFATELRLGADTDAKRKDSRSPPGYPGTASL